MVSLFVVLISIVTLMSSCALKTSWTKNGGGTQSEFDRDNSACSHDFAYGHPGESAGATLGRLLAEVMLGSPESGRCMEGKGWTKS